MAEEQARGFQPTSGRDVFISYASHDKAVAESVCDALESAGLACWIAPRDVVPGESFAGAIVHAIDATKVIVLVLSEHAADSQHVLREVERATSKRHAVIAFRLDLKALPADFEYFLNTSQWLDASTTGVRRALPKLVKAVEGAMAQASAEPGDIPAHTVAIAVTKRWRTALIGTAALVFAIVAYLPIDRFLISKPGTALPLATSGKHLAEDSVQGVGERSIAVLPFIDMSEKHDQEYFGDGMAEEILDLLAKVPGLHVPARTSSFYFKGKSEDIPTIARRLMVANILEGSVRKSGNHVRVTVQLVRADNGYHLWSETYDRTLDDLFKVQDDIAGEIVRALKISMDTSAGPRTVPTKSAEAHRLLLQAQFFLYRGTGDDPKTAAGYFHQAIDADPDFAEAWAGLSEALNTGGQATEQARQHVHELALRAAERAVALDPKLAEAHVALGGVRYWQEWDWAAANSEYEMARSLDPANSAALNGAGLIAALHGRLPDALHLWDQAAVRNPLSSFAYNNIADTYYAMGRFTEALAAMRKCVELDPNAEAAHAILAQMLLGVGQSDDALAEVKKESDPGFRAYALARTYIVLGRKGDADAALANVEKKFAAEQAYNIADLHALRGDRDQAFSWLDRAYQQHDTTIIGLPPITVDPDIRNLHGDPRYEAFLRKMKLP